jgi:hypothetical protein
LAHSHGPTALTTIDAMEIDNGYSKSIRTHSRATAGHCDPCSTCCPEGSETPSAEGRDQGRHWHSLSGLASPMNGLPLIVIYAEAAASPIVQELSNSHRRRRPDPKRELVVNQTLSPDPFWSGLLSLNGRGLLEQSVFAFAATSSLSFATTPPAPVTWQLKDGYLQPYQLN